MLFSEHTESLRKSHHHLILDSILHIVAIQVEDTYMLSQNPAPLHHDVTCSKLRHVTYVTCVTCVTCVTVTPARPPSQWPTESMQLLGLSTSNTAAFPLKTIIG